MQNPQKHPPDRMTWVMNDEKCWICRKKQYYFTATINHPEGWLMCQECQEKYEKVLRDYWTIDVQGLKAIYGNTIRIERGTGVVEENWQFHTDFPFAVRDENGDMRVRCVDPSGKFTKNIKIATLEKHNKKRF
jgi:hypothetical protein